MLISADPLTRLATLATLSPKEAREIVKRYAGTLGYGFWDSFQIAGP
jgi:hypothetical protein